MAFDIIDIPSQNHNGREATPIQALVIHCIGLGLEEVVRGFTHKHVAMGGLGVSPHYFIPQLTGQEFIDQFSKELGQSLDLAYPDRVPVIRFVKEQDRAWHAGASSWGELNALPNCKSSLNSCSIGIEFHAPGYGGSGKDWFHFTPYTNPQMATGALLIKDICNRHSIAPHNIIGHSDIASWTLAQIKTDPGPLFPWEWLYDRYDIGIWPSSEQNGLPPQNQVAFVKQQLTDIGYRLSPDQNWTDLDRYVVNAFRMRFMSKTYKGYVPSDKEFGQIDSSLVEILQQLKL